MIHKLYAEGICSILIEGGKKVHESFFNEDLIDEIYTYTSNKVIEGASLKNPLLLDDKWTLNDSIYLEEDILQIVKKKELCLQES